MTLSCNILYKKWSLYVKTITLYLSIFQFIYRNEMCIRIKSFNVNATHIFCFIQYSFWTVQQYIQYSAFLGFIQFLSTTFVKQENLDATINVLFQLCYIWKQRCYEDEKIRKTNIIISVLYCCQSYVNYAYLTID